jgi:hypothetical protein
MTIRPVSLSGSDETHRSHGSYGSDEEFINSAPLAPKTFGAGRWRKESVWRSAFSILGDRGDVGVLGVSWRVYLCSLGLDHGTAHAAVISGPFQVLITCTSPSGTDGSTLSSLAPFLESARW